MTNEYVYSEGREVPVEVLADGTGTVAREGEGVALVGENADAVTVELVEAESDRAVGILTEDPRDFQMDEDAAQADYAAGDSAGMASTAILFPIVWVDTDGGYNPSVGDYAKMADGGDIEAFTGPTASGLGGAVTNNLGIDGNGNLETDNGGDIDVNFTQDAFPFGTVFTTIAREWGVGDRTGVIKGVL
jgi:hypothetical protein